MEGLTGERDALWARVGAAGFLTDDEKREAVGYGARGGIDRKYRPDQTRVPAGNPDGGQWTDEGGPHEIADRSGREAQGARKYSVNLAEEEAPIGIGHTIRKHVAKSDAELLANLERNTYRGWFFDYVDGQEGTFESLERANDLTNRVLEMSKDKVDEVASGAKESAHLKVRFGYVTGREVRRTADHPEPYFRKTYGVAVVIRHDSRSKRGYYIVTSHPRNFGKDDEL